MTRTHRETLAETGRVGKTPTVGIRIGVSLIVPTIDWGGVGGVDVKWPALLVCRIDFAEGSKPRKIFLSLRRPLQSSRCKPSEYDGNARNQHDAHDNHQDLHGVEWQRVNIRSLCHWAGHWIPAVEVKTR